MLYDELKYYRSDINKIKSLSPDSKEYKRTFFYLRAALGRYAIQDFKNAKKGDSLHFYKKEYYLRVVISALLLVFALIIIALIIGFFGHTETTVAETLFLLALMVISLLLSFIALGVSFTVQTLTDKYLHQTIDTFYDEQSKSPDA